MEFILVQVLLPVVCALLASSGMWTFFSKRADLNSSTKKLIIGIAHDRIIDLGLKYINRGNITKGEYENLVVYLYKPYLALGGNGSAKHIMDLVDKLPIVSLDFQQLRSDQDETE